MSQVCTVIVRLIPHAGQTDAVRHAMNEVIEEIRAGAGCVRYDMFDAVNGEIVLFEQWESRGSWQAHFDTEPIKWLQAELADKVELPVERLEMYAPGEPDSHIS